MRHMFLKERDASLNCFRADYIHLKQSPDESSRDKKVCKDESSHIVRFISAGCVKAGSSWTEFLRAAAASARRTHRRWCVRFLGLWPGATCKGWCTET